MKLHFLLKYSYNLCSEIAVPEKVFFVDCNALGPNEFAISWGWPLVSEQDVPEETLEATISEVVDKSVLHAVIEYSDSGLVWRVNTSTSPYIFKGIMLYNNPY